MFMNRIFIFKGECDAYAFLQSLVAKKYNNVEIAKNEKGKPYFKNIDGLYFSLSHTDGLTVVAVGESEVGIDAERLRKADLRVTRRFLKDEAGYITATDSDKRFFEVWTKKEAFLKYNGTGLAGGLDSINVFECDPKIETFYFEDYVISVCSKNNYEVEK